MVVILAGTWSFFRQAVHTLPCNMGTSNASWLPEYWDVTNIIADISL